MVRPTNEEIRYKCLRAVIDPVEWNRLCVSNSMARDRELDESTEDAPVAEEDAPVDVELPLFVAMGINTGWAPAKLAPPVDESRLMRLRRNELPPEEFDDTIRLMARFRSWYEAWCKTRRRFNGFSE